MLAHERVRYIGDPVAFVVADSLNLAKDAAELIEVDYEPLPAVVDARAGDRRPARRACGTTAPTIMRSCTRRATGPRPRRLSRAPRTSCSTASRSAASPPIRWSRAAASPNTTAREDRYTLRCTVQGPHTIRRVHGERHLQGAGDQVPRDLRERRRRLRHEGRPLPGIRAGVPRGDACSARPVKWISERGEGILSDEHCRDNLTDAELALDNDGRFLGAARAHLRQHRRLQQLRPQCRSAHQQHRRARRHLHDAGDATSR